MDSLEDLLRSQKEVAGRIDRFMDNTRKAGKQKMVGRFLKKRQQLLGDYWKEFQAGHRLIACRSDAEGSDYLESDLYSQVEDAYLSQDVELEDMIRGPESPARPSSGGKRLKTPLHQAIRTSCFRGLHCPPFRETCWNGKGFVICSNQWSARSKEFPTSAGFNT